MNNCNHSWLLCVRENQKSPLSTSLLLRGCPKCGQVRRFVEGTSEEVTELCAVPTQSERFVLIKEQSS